MQIPKKNTVKEETEQKVNAPCESLDDESKVSTSSDSKTYEIDAKELKSKASFRKLIAKDGANVLATLKPGLHQCNCPFHDDVYGRLFIWSNDAGAKCVVCGWRGDIYDYIMKKHDVGFYDAVLTLYNQLNDVLRDEEGAGHGAD